MRKRLAIILVLLGALWAWPAQAFTPNDPLLSQQWAVGAMGLTTAWDYNQGGRSDVRVAVLDTGVAYDIADFGQTHFDLGSAYDYVNNDSDPYDDNGHGTHVAAVIAQSTNNGTGAAGIAWNTTIIPIKVLDSSGAGQADALVQGIYRAVAAGADIINISWGLSSSFSELEAACQAAYNAGILVVASAGNSGGSQAMYPARYSSVLPVAAVGSNLGLGGGSNSAWGDSGAGLSAPGVGIVQVTAAGTSSRSGTSMAAPQVSGVAALVLSEAYDLGLSIPGGSGRVDWLKSILFSSAQDLGSAGVDGTYGYGLVRADSALQSLQASSQSVEETASGQTQPATAIGSTDFESWYQPWDPLSYSRPRTSWDY